MTYVNEVNEPSGLMINFRAVPLTKEQLLAEVEDLLRNAPPAEEVAATPDPGLAWLGRVSAVVRAWDYRRGPELMLAQQQFESMNLLTNQNGYRRVIVLLNEARHTLRLATIGPLSVPIGHGQVFDYFDEVRKITELAKQDLLFVDPYLDADFVSRYLSHVAKGVAIRLLAREKLTSLLPAVDMFSKQTGSKIQVRSAAKFHDRYVFVDRATCYQSGASFKDGARSAPTTLTQITDAFAAIFQTYENIWSTTKVER